MKTIEDLRKQTSYSLKEIPTWASIVIIMMFPIAFFTNDLKGMILSVFGISTVGLASVVLKQQKINRILVNELDKLRCSNAAEEEIEPLR